MKSEIFIIQKEILRKIKKYFEVDVENMKCIETPMEPGSNIVPPKDCEEVLDILNQNKYQSGVGTLMYLVKNSRPDINNSVRELSKCMMRASQENMNILYRVMKYVLDTKDKGLFLKPKFEDEKKFYC